jgi:signal transduction histidine kinase/DNA-binding response OmpR family regulator
MLQKCLIFVLLFAWNANAQIISLDPNTQFPLTISEQAYQLTDSTATLSLAEVENQTFTRIGSTNFLLPYSDAAYWYKFTVKNNFPHSQKWYVEWENHTVERIECYLPQPDGSYRRKIGGSLFNKSRLARGETTYFGFEVPSGEQQTLYIRVKSQRGHRTDLIIYSGPSLYASRINSVSNNSFAGGLVFLRLFFVLLLAIFAVKDRAFRAYSFIIVLRSLSFWGLNGHLSKFLTDNLVLATRIDFLSYHLIPVGYVVVLMVLLPLSRMAGWVRYLLFGIVAVELLLGVGIMVDYQWYWLLASQYMVLASQLLVFGLYLYTAFRKWPINWYYSVPFLLGVGSYFFLVLGAVGIIDAVWVYGLAYLLFVSEIFVFGLFLGKIILDYRRERESVQRELIFKDEQAQRLKELDTLKTNFFANISHEFRTPLTLLVGPLEDFRLQQPTNALIPAMQRSVRRLKSLIDQLLDLARLEAGHLTPTIALDDIAVFMRQTFASFESLAQRRHIIFNYQQSESSHQAYFDRDKLENIVTNLLSNAFKFTPEGGRVHVQAHYDDRELILEVQDFGIGIETERLPHIFDRFYRIETPGQYNAEGTGIGLSLVHELVKVLRGNIRAESQVGRGTTFTLHLPIDAATWADIPLHTSPAPVTAHAEPDPVALPVVTEPVDVPLILLVEDNPDLREYLRSVFSHYRLMEAADGQEGLDLAFAEVPDLVVCDVMMPRLDGYGFCEKLKSDIRTSHIPVIMLTARAALEDRLEGLKLGADDYLTKPFNRSELLVRVQNLLKQRELLRQKYTQQLATSSGSRTKPTDSIDDQFLQHAIDIVTQQGSDSGFGIDILCQAMNTSRSNLHRKLKALTGQSTTEFIRSIRIYRAAELLKQPGITVSEVAYQVGFESASYFSRAFREQMGTSPSDWAVSAHP